jgi:hypothetical protein
MQGFVHRSMHSIGLQHGSNIKPPMLRVTNGLTQECSPKGCDEVDPSHGHQMHCQVRHPCMQIGEKSGCKSLVLTHFSQRYPKVPELKDASQNMHLGHVAVACDLMRLDLNDLDAPSAVLPILSLLFKEEAPDAASH